VKLKITTVGNSAGVILPKELLARLRLEKGDELFALETPDGVRLSVYDPKLAAQMEVAERVMREDRAVLHKLAQQRGHDVRGDAPLGGRNVDRSRIRRLPAPASCSMPPATGCWNLAPGAPAFAEQMPTARAPLSSHCRLAS
jgi:putative addiction module antidote